jgi:hypothetical protein
MQYLNSRYVEWFNRKYGREGHLVERRFRARLLANEAETLDACRYVVLNPLRASVCVDPAEWPSSSHRAVIGLAPVPGFLSLARTLGYFGGDRDAYCTFVNDALPALPASA